MLNPLDKIQKVPIDIFDIITWMWKISGQFFFLIVNCL